MLSGVCNILFVSLLFLLCYSFFLLYFGGGREERLGWLKGVRPSVNVSKINNLYSYQLCVIFSLFFFIVFFFLPFFGGGGGEVGGVRGNLVKWLMSATLDHNPNTTNYHLNSLHMPTQGRRFFTGRFA